MCYTGHSCFSVVTAGTQIKAENNRRHKLRCLSAAQTWCIEEAHHICATTIFTEIRNNGVSKRTRGLVQCSEFWMLGKDLWVWERRERIMNFSKSESSKQRNLSVSLFFSLSQFFPPFSLFNSPSLSPLSLLERLRSL